MSSYESPSLQDKEPSLRTQLNIATESGAFLQDTERVKEFARESQSLQDEEAGLSEQDLEHGESQDDEEAEDYSDLSERPPDIDDMRYRTVKNEITKQHDDREPIVGPSEREDNNIVDHEAPGRRTRNKVDLEKIFVISNFVLELPSAVFDQLSSVHKPQYALFSMLMSFLALLVCIIELVHKGRKGRVAWKWKCTLPWLYYPQLQNHKPFGNFKDIIGLVCALCQSIVTAIGYGFVHRHADSPIKVSVWPIIFAFGLLCSKFLDKPERRTGSISQR